MFFEPGYFLPLTAAVVGCSWLFGKEGGIHATVVGAILADYILIKPRYTFSLSNRTEVFGLVLFLVTGLLITWLTSMLRESRELQTSIMEGMRDALAVTDRKGNIIYLNPSAEALSGYSADEAEGEQFERVFDLKEEGSGESRPPIMTQIMSGSAMAISGAHTILTSKDGTSYSVEEDAAPIRQRGGRITGAIAVLRNTTRRRQVQDQLTQSQKMEAIGRLAGGVAGDFNNLLTVITGFGELLTSEMKPENPLRHFAEEILNAAERATMLTRHLLAFGSGLAVPSKVYDINSVLANFQPMLERMLGPGIEVVLLLSARNSRIKTDPGQMEQVLVNLALNARDAMPNGGKFVIETSEVEIRPDTPGRLPEIAMGEYIMLAVTDSGVGMDADTRAHLFEPFFTTKTQGKGSGLGLSIVYGIVKQHGGYVSVYSQPGSGTILEIYFPKAKEPSKEVAGRRNNFRGSETILIADDEESVRKLVQHVLAASGYTVIEARDGKEALDLFQENSKRVDMVLTDVVMPQMTGFELSEQIGRLDPAKKIMFMSGYRDVQSGSDKDQTRPFLNKPFTPDVLLKQVRDTLDARA